MESKYSPRPLIEGAMLAVITVLLSLIPMASVFVPVPLILIIYRHDLRWGILTAVTASILGGMLLGVVSGFVFLLIMGFVGVAIGGALAEGFSPNKVLVVGTAAFFVSLLMMLAFSSIVLGENLIELFLEAIQEGFQRASEFYEGMGVEPQTGFSAEQTQALMRLIRMILPAVFIASSVLHTFINYWMARLLLNRFGADLEWFPPFGTWRFSWYWAWGFIGGFFLSLAGQYIGTLPLTAVGENLRVLFMTLFLIQGLAIAWFFLSRWRVARLLRYVILFFLLVNPLFSNLIVFAGVFDTWFDFRKLEHRVEG